MSAKVAGTIRFPVEDGVIQPLLVADRTLAAEPPHEESLLRK
jgi:hypothetical protein